MAEERDAKERLSMLTWMIDRYDVLRVAISRRAAIVLSADAILVTATIFLFGQYHSGYLANAAKLTTAEEVITVAFIVFAVGTIGLLCMSILSATSSIVNVWGNSRDMLGDEPPHIYFFHARDTYEELGNFNTFRNRLEQSSNEDFISYAQAELWRVTVATYHRHNDLKKAIQYLYYAIFPFMISLFICSIMIVKPLFT